MMTIIVAARISGHGDSDSVPSNPAKGARTTKTTARIGKTIVVAGGRVWAVMRRAGSSLRAEAIRIPPPGPISHDGPADLRLTRRHAVHRFRPGEHHEPCGTPSGPKPARNSRAIERLAVRGGEKARGTAQAQAQGRGDL